MTTCTYLAVSAVWVASVDEAWVAWVVLVGADQEDTAQTVGSPAYHGVSADETLIRQGNLGRICIATQSNTLTLACLGARERGTVRAVVDNGASGCFDTIRAC